MRSKKDTEMSCLEDQMRQRKAVDTSTRRDEGLPALMRNRCPQRGARTPAAAVSQPSLSRLRFS